MIAFFVMTGIFAASSLVPALERRNSLQVAVLYYKKRLRRILPAYLCSLVLAAAVVLLCRVGTPKHSYAVEIGRYFAATDLKNVWVDLTFSVNLAWRLGIVNYQWNLGPQVQFWAVVPLALLALQPARQGFRARLARACISVMALSLVYRAVMVHVWGVTVPFSLYALDTFNVAGSAGHDPQHEQMCAQFFYGIHASLAARSFDFAAGILIYIAITSPSAIQRIRSRPAVCTSVTGAVVVVNAILCLSGDKAHEGHAFPPAPPAVSYIVHLVVIGMLCPLSVIWTLLYILAQPDALSRYLGNVLSSKPFKFGAGISMSFWMVDWPVITLMLYLLPGWWALNSFNSFVAFATLNISLAAVLAWVQDNLIETYLGKPNGGAAQNFEANHSQKELR